MENLKEPFERAVKAAWASLESEGVDFKTNKKSAITAVASSFFFEDATIASRSVRVPGEPKGMLHYFNHLKGDTDFDPLKSEYPAGTTYTSKHRSADLRQQLMEDPIVPIMAALLLERMIDHCDARIRAALKL